MVQELNPGCQFCKFYKETYHTHHFSRCMSPNLDRQYIEFDAIVGLIGGDCRSINVLGQCKIFRPGKEIFKLANKILKGEVHQLPAFHIQELRARDSIEIVDQITIFAAGVPGAPKDIISLARDFPIQPLESGVEYKGPYQICNVDEGSQFCIHSGANVIMLNHMPCIWIYPKEFITVFWLEDEQKWTIDDPASEPEETENYFNPSENIDQSLEEKSPIGPVDTEETLK